MRIFVALLFCFGCISNCWGSVLTFADRVSWRSAAGGGIGDLAEDFNSISSDLSFNFGASQSVGFLTFSGDPGMSDVYAKIDASVFEAGSMDIDGSTYAILRSVGGNHTTVSFNEVFAIGFDFDASFFGTDSMAFNIQTSAGDIVALPSGLNARGFFGIVSSDPITSFQTLGSSDRLRGTDNWEAFATPEPSSLLCITVGGCILAWRRKRVFY